MSLSFIASVNTELKRRHKGLVTTVGWKERSKHSSPPCVRWVADSASVVDPIPRDGDIAQALVGRVLRYSVECWGSDLDETQALAKSVMRVCHRLGTSGAYSCESEEWQGLEGSGGAILGEMAVLTIGIRDDVLDDDDTTVDAPNPAAPPTGGFT